MPNWITNEVHMEGIGEKDEKYFTSDPETGQKYFDFEKLIPMPECLKEEYASGSDADALIYTAGLGLYGIIRGGINFDAEYIVKAIDALRPILDRVSNNIKNSDSVTLDQVTEQGEKALHNVIETGCMNWYDWANTNWGTKWNSCMNYDIDQDTVGFCTAWSSPQPVLEELSRQNPDKPIDVYWVDEGYYPTIYTDQYRNGSLTGSMVEHAVPSPEYKDYNRQLMERYNQIVGAEYDDTFDEVLDEISTPLDRLIDMVVPMYAPPSPDNFINKEENDD